MILILAYIVRTIYNKRIVTERNIFEIISELEKTEWDEILNSDDIMFCV